jgi:hypothetical protein
MAKGVKMQRGTPLKNLDDSLEQKQGNGPNVVTCPLILKDQEKEKYKHTDYLKFPELHQPLVGQPEPHSSWVVKSTQRHTILTL